ncbi:hypothetical protein T484DRAFT_1789309, partial [Baffinella frigidus]
MATIRVRQGPAGLKEEDAVEPANKKALKEEDAVEPAGKKALREVAWHALKEEDAVEPAGKKALREVKRRNEYQFGYGGRKLACER